MLGMDTENSLLRTVQEAKQTLHLVVAASLGKSSFADDASLLGTGSFPRFLVTVDEVHLASRPRLRFVETGDSRSGALMVPVTASP